MRDDVKLNLNAKVYSKSKMKLPISQSQNSYPLRPWKSKSHYFLLMTDGME